MEALETLRQQVGRLHDLMNDPFKAPELSIFMLPDLQAAAWNAQVEYAAMARASEKDTL